VTLEHAYPDSDGGFYPKIPAGEYICKRGIHQLEGMATPFETFEITNVKGQINILFHAGNFNNDSEGCVLVGEKLGKYTHGQMIVNSKATFNNFMRMQNGIDFFKLTVLS